MRPIDADALIETWRKRACEDCDKRKGWKNGKTVGFIYDIGEAPCRACWVDDMLGELEDAPTVNEWISVKDRLPEDGERVLTLDEYGDIRIEQYGEQEYDWFDDGTGLNSMTTILYWMQLPPPPEGGQDD